MDIQLLCVHDVNNDKFWSQEDRVLVLVEGERQSSGFNVSVTSSQSTALRLFRTWMSGQLYVDLYTELKRSAIGHSAADHFLPFYVPFHAKIGRRRPIGWKKWSLQVLSEMTNNISAISNLLPAPVRGTGDVCANRLHFFSRKLWDVKAAAAADCDN